MTTRADVLAEVRAADDPIDIATISRRVGIPATTARFHLNALERDGVVERVSATAHTPGRPRLTYRARRGMDPSGPRRYLPLAHALLADLADASAAERIGRRWGEALSPDPALPSLDALTQVLADLDFAPEVVDESRIDLTHCPFLELAHESSHRICSLHLGLLRGAAAEMTAPIDVVALEPFAAPGVCIVRIDAAG
ncbi:winged helix-turn-helix transcriptional regulator [Gordonia sp. TBRC 11910]|uniref:Winged helix-turn-helix transcriptional regulator n=1 Tax=Gordonia asplenii TaxID=2725283 RepID=A0A848L0N1_9ACTN|nr:helix-turn-helix domain-containing protein [Gordonia asplenii]NMO04454.1 winged helix-turn-helix transcriptional regulator [Gordonia asplenii]